MSKVSKLPNKAQAKAEAAEWLIRLDRGGLTEAESGELKTWVARHKINSEYLLKLAGTWDDMTVLSQLAEVLPLKTGEQEGKAEFYTGGTGGIFSKLQLPGVAIPLIVLCATVTISIFVNYGWEDRSVQSEYQINILRTEVGRQATHVLDDGSTIVLNTDSLVKLEFTASRRVVRLLQGEAAFSVSADKDRPFIVYVGSGTVWAVGTAFNVRLTSGNVHVTVTEGRVGINPDTSETESMIELLNLEKEKGKQNSKVVMLDAGQVALYRDKVENIKQLSKDQLAQKLAWHHGALVFKGEPLEEVISEVTRYTNIKIKIADSKINQMPVGGYFKINDIDALLTTLDEGFHVKVEKIGTDLVLLSAKGNRL